MQGDVAHENYITTTPKSIFNLLMQINLSRWPWAFEETGDSLQMLQQMKWENGGGHDNIMFTRAQKPKH